LLPLFLSEARFRLSRRRKAGAQEAASKLAREKAAASCTHSKASLPAPPRIRGQESP